MEKIDERKKVEQMDKDDIKNDFEEHIGSLGVMEPIIETKSCE